MIVYFVNLVLIPCWEYDNSVWIAASPYYRTDIANHIIIEYRIGIT